MSRDTSYTSTLPSIASSTRESSSSTDSENFLGGDYSHTSSFLEGHNESIDPDAETVFWDREDTEMADTLDREYLEMVDTLGTDTEEFETIEDNDDIPFVPNIAGMSDTEIDRELPLHTQIGDSLVICPTCFDTIQNQQFFRRMPCCGQIFHNECIHPWLRTAGRCPACNRPPMNYDV